MSGRFRAEKLGNMAEVTTIQAEGGRYLIDETTAITRFIFPCKDTDEAELVSWFFELPYIKSVIDVVNGEAEIWMTESGQRNRLHVWKVRS